jgi:hypothetical protein
MRNPGLKIETWATHSIFVRAIFIFLGCPKADGTIAGVVDLRVLIKHPQTGGHPVGTHYHRPIEDLSKRRQST